ncbi:MAG: FAD-binding protein, partial [Campylobacteraceae bacterium]|nr:FAD-binding protein [Campylobacteraceae bacterium]
NTFYAQGGIAVANSKADVSKHINDTKIAGSFHGNEEAIHILCQEGPLWVQALIDGGFLFDCDENGKLDYTKEAAHSSNRVLHANGDATGRALHVHLMQRLNAHFLYNAQVVDLSIKDNHCNGVCLYYKGKMQWIGANYIVLASGGVGSLYAYNTNARSVSADLQGIALEKEIVLKDMEMMQFHPTVYIQGKGARKQLLSEALRGEGAKVVDSSGTEFLSNYHTDAELAPRDIVSQAIFDHCNYFETKAFLNDSAWSEAKFASRFPTIYFEMRDAGIMVPKEKIPISPAFHYAMGGIATDLNGRVLGLENLYAAGEVAHTGVHGANRLASNSLLEGLVFSARVAKTISSTFTAKEYKVFPNKNIQLELPKDESGKDLLRTLCWKYAGIIRTKEGLENALNRIEEMLKCRTGKLLRLRLLASQAIFSQALARKTSLGAHQIVKNTNIQEGKK